MLPQQLRHSLFVLVLMVSIAVSGVAETLQVPNQYSTIQAAIDAAADGDVVEIADGTYAGAGNKDFDFLGKAITVRSAAGQPECVTIDCEGAGRGFYFRSGEGPDSVVEGITITNGFVDDSSLGGAWGGGVSCLASDPTLINCTIANNTADRDGGGLWCGLGSPALLNCTIRENAASLDGGGVYCIGSTASFVNCSITRNAAIIGLYDVGGSGGGIYCTGSSRPTLTNCEISENLAGSHGGSVFCDTGGPVLTNCILRDSVPREIQIDSGDPIVTYCVVQGASGEPWFGTGCIDTDVLLTPDGHATAESPCIDAGDPNGTYAGLFDIDGENRVVGGRVDIGRDEWLDGDTDALPDWWEQKHFADPQIANPLEDEDDDGLLNRYEYAAGRDPWQSPRTYHVSLDGNDAWDGLAPEWDGTHGPKLTIQAAIDDCLTYENDEVAIADGTFAGVGNKNLDFGGRAITVRSVSGDPSRTIIDCEGNGRGFVFRCWEGPDSVVSSVTIMNGFAGQDSLSGSFGGGVLCDKGSSPTLSDCVILRNWALEEGGGIYCHYSQPVLVGCGVCGNTAGSCGGGAACGHFGSPVFTNCTVTGNSAWDDGGGVFCDWYSSLTLSSCTISRNTSLNSGGGVICCYSCLTFTNCIFWGDEPGEIIASSSSTSVTYSAVEDGRGHYWYGVGCVETDPLLTPDGHLTAESPCINAGDPNGSYTGQLDRDGESRVLADRVDMGADEWLDADVDGLPDWWEQQFFDDPTSANARADGDEDGMDNLDEYCVGRDPLHGPRAYFVSLSGSDVWDGLAAAWDGQHGPKATIQAAIDGCHAREGDTVEIACGTYTGLGNTGLDFLGRAITVRSATGDPNCVIIDCDEADRGFFLHSNEGADSVVQGLTITNGSVGDDGLTGKHGGGVCCRPAAPSLVRCVISGNSAPQQGGGLYCIQGDASLTACSIDGNTAGGAGGGIYSSKSRIECDHCVIRGNSAGSGGAVYSSSTGSWGPILTNCTIVGNAAGGRGGAIRCVGSRVQLFECTVVGNRAAQDGGGFWGNTGRPKMVNTILWDNLPQEVYAVSRCDPELLYCVVRDGWPGEGNIDADPLFVDPDGPDGDPNTWQDNDYHLSVGSPCIDAGEPDFVAADGETDIDGQWRIWDGNGDGMWRVDMGADELTLDCPGDVDGSGVVDLHDLQFLLSHYGETSNITSADGDLDFDADVDLRDLQILLSQFGTECE